MNLFELFVKIGVDDQASDKVEDISKKLGKGLQTATKVGTTALVSLGVAAVKTYADYEQLVGGVDTLFKSSSQKVQKYASEAYKSAGLSANAYMETVTSFSASLLQSLGGDTEKAADYADQAIIDMADNANKMGTSIEMIQNAYQGFAKQNYTMLDNLKLGYGGTQAEMIRLLKDADALSESFNLVEDENGDLVYSFADIVEAIHIMQEEMGIAGATAQEAEKTISGSFNAMKASASNFLTALIDDNADVGAAFDELTGTVSTFVGNVTPKIWDFLEALGPIAPVIVGITTALVSFKAAAAITGIIDAAVKSYQAFKKANEGATIAQWALNTAMSANLIGIVVALLAGLTAALVVLWNTNDDFANALTRAWQGIANGAKIVWGGVAKFFTEMIPNAFKSVINWFGDVGKWFADIGKNIVLGIKTGIKNAWNDMVSWFKSLFGDLIGIAKKILGIASPSKVFKKIGLQTAEGYEIGFEDEFAKVKDDMEDALNFDDASVGINASIRKVGAGAAGGAFGGTSIGNININIDGAKYADEQSLASAIAFEIQNMTDRRAAVYA